MGFHKLNRRVATAGWGVCGMALGVLVFITPAPAAEGAASAASQSPSSHSPADTWATATPEEVGMDAQVLEELVAFGASQEMDSLVITRHGRLVREAYFGGFQAEHRHRLNSATKGVVAALVGVAVAQGKISGTDAPVLGFFPGRVLAQRDAAKEAITLQHLLDMTSGLDWQEPLTGGRVASLIGLRSSADWVQYVLDRPMAQLPGTGFNYNSGNSHLLAAILERQTGMPLKDYAQQQLLVPLGITDVAWETDPQGLYTGGFGLHMRTRDMARLALLYLRGGEWNGCQLVPRDWIARVFVPGVSMGMGPIQYADQWWSVPERGVFMAVGFNRQILLVMPRHGIAAAFTGRRHWSFGPWMDLLDRAVALPARSVPLLSDERQGQPSAACVPTTTDCGPSSAGCEIRSSMTKVR